jgi:hypothetical protein
VPASVKLCARFISACQQTCSHVWKLLPANRQTSRTTISLMPFIPPTIRSSTDLSAGSTLVLLRYIRRLFYRSGSSIKSTNRGRGMIPLRVPVGMAPRHPGYIKQAVGRLKKRCVRRSTRTRSVTDFSAGHFLTCRSAVAVQQLT